jgi:hypothetical protein
MSVMLKSNFRRTQLCVTTMVSVAAGGSSFLFSCSAAVVVVAEADL